jgi:hypothetical protein
MASGFPASIDNFTDPLSNSPLNSPSHSALHSDVNDAVEKIETYMGLVKVIPTGATNGTVGATGTVTIGSAVSSVAVAGCFSATYDNYQIVIAGADSSALNNLVVLALNNSTGSTYNSSIVYMVHNSGQGSNTGTNANFRVAFGGDTSDTNSNIILYSPFLVRRTGMNAMTANGNLFGSSGGVDTNAVSNTGFTISVGVDTLTGGTITVYGYRK